MLKEVQEYKKHLGIVGFRNVHIRKIEQFLDSVNKEKLSDVEVQFFNAKFIATWQHLYFATLNALTAFHNKQNISNSVAMETMLYASAQHQIRVATQMIGIEYDIHTISTLVIADSTAVVTRVLQAISKVLNAEPDDTVLEITKEKGDAIKKMFKISRAELQLARENDELEQALANIVIERMAMLATHH